MVEDKKYIQICVSCNIIFQSAIKIDISLTKVQYLFYYMPIAYLN